MTLEGWIDARKRKVLPASNEAERRCLELAEILIPALSEVAKRHGYALAVHGSLRRDIDLLAVPWREMEVAPGCLAEALRACCESIVGQALLCGGEQPVRKPHGRLGWSWHLGGGPYVDLSVMPPSSEGSARRRRRKGAA